MDSNKIMDNLKDSKQSILNSINNSLNINNKYNKNDSEY